MDIAKLIHKFERGVQGYNFFCKQNEVRKRENINWMFDQKGLVNKMSK